MSLQIFLLKVYWDFDCDCIESVCQLNRECIFKNVKYCNPWRSFISLFAHHHRQSLQSCLTLCDPMDCSPPGPSVHVIFQARTLEWVAKTFFRGSSWPRNWTSFLMSPALAGRFFNTSTAWEAIYSYLLWFRNVLYVSAEILCIFIIFILRFLSILLLSCVIMIIFFVYFFYIR